VIDVTATQRRYVMSQKVIRFLATMSCAAVMLFLTAEYSEAAHGGGGHGGGGHGGGGHGGGFHGGGFHSGGGWHGGGRGWHDGGWGHHGYYRGFYGGYYPGLYGLWDYPYYSYGYTDYPYYGYADSNYPSYGYSDSYYNPNYYAPSPAYGSGAASAYGTYAPPVATDNTVRLTVRVPPDAQVWFENTLTTQRGAERDFQSPQLTPGRDYTYDIRARWRQDGRDVDQTRHVTVHAGSQVNVDFTAPASDKRQGPSSASTSGS
jgi:uncharacterized protein (TIGR03000 family)